ncbi:MAG: ATP-binding cassette domain-containing protein [Chloroflexota bacterium]
MSDEPLLEATGLRLAEGSRPFDFRLSAGEIVGLAGLDGHGQAAFLEALAGVRAPLSGRVEALRDGRRHAVRDARSGYAQGIVYLPQNRKDEGIFPSLSVLDNFRMLTLGRTGRLGFLSPHRDREAFATHRERLGIVLASPSAPITSLSGGNQQKVLLARLLEAQPRVMLLNDPTRGVDHPTRLGLFALFDDLARDSGLGVVVLSTEIDEVVSHCHRAIVFREGAPSAELDRPALTMDAVLAAMFGQAAAAS